MTVALARAGIREAQQRALRLLPAVDARRAEKDDGVLNIFLTESPQRVEILGENAERASVGTVEKRLVVVRERLFGGHLQKLFHRLGG